MAGRSELCGRYRKAVKETDKDLKSNVSKLCFHTERQEVAFDLHNAINECKRPVWICQKCTENAREMKKIIEKRQKLKQKRMELQEDWTILKAREKLMEKRQREIIQMTKVLKSSVCKLCFHAERQEVALDLFNTGNERKRQVWICQKCIENAREMKEVMEENQKLKEEHKELQEDWTILKAIEKLMEKKQREIIQKIKVFKNLEEDKQMEEAKEEEDKQMEVAMEEEDKQMEVAKEEEDKQMEERQLKKQRSKNKGKERRAEQKAEAARIKEGQRLVKLAQEVPDPLAKFPSFHKFERNGLSCKLIYRRVADMDEPLLEWAIDITKRNMQPLYEKSSGGWKENMKREEMTEDAACFLVAVDTATDKPLGFSHFRFDMDYGVEVLYCYELQLEPECRQKGLGRFMLQVLELMAFTNQMGKVVLTVFKHNLGGITFFTKCKYALDDTSPEDSFDETFDYCIMSKENKVKRSQKTSL